MNFLTHLFLFVLFLLTIVSFSIYHEIGDFQCLLHLARLMVKLLQV